MVSMLPGPTSSAPARPADAPVRSSLNYRLHFDADGEIRDAALDCEADVFLKAYGNTAEQLADEYGPYDEASSFIAVSDDQGEVVAAARLINPSPLGLKTIDDLGRDPWNIDGRRSARAAGLNIDNMWDVATFGVRKGAAGGMLLSAALYHAVIQGGNVNEMDGIVMIMDERARRLFTSIGFYSHPFPGARPGPYLGSPKSTPLWGRRIELVDGQRRSNPEAFRLITQGIGMDGIDLPDREGFRLKSRIPLAAPGWDSSIVA